jgi:C4-dicarboxylate-specific signal transduction histidine kinase
MENYQIIISAFFILMTITLAFALFRKSKEANNLRDQLKQFKGQTDDELYSRGKFSELGLMSAGITHEISNPLSIIVGRITQLMRIDPSPEKKAELQKGLEQIKTNAERISSILKSVREYIYRNDEQTEDFISLREIINSVLMFYGQRLKNHGIELRLKDIENIYVSGHKGQFEQALLNLISNSFDAIDNLKEKWIEISAEKSGDNVQIFVKDSGFGIPAEVREHILDPFFTTKKNKGSGLGLSLVKGIAEKHGGELKYVEDEHTTFMLQLPQASSMQYHH